MSLNPQENIYKGLLGRPGMKYALYTADKDGKPVLRFVQEKIVDSYGKKVDIEPETLPEARALIERRFGQRIERLSGGNSAIKAILERMYMEGFDEGVKGSKDFNGFVEPGHPILGRKAMLTELKKQAGLKFDLKNQTYISDKKFRILTLDLAGFREADLQGSGDYDLNIFTRQINLAIEEIAKKLHIDPNDLIASRYGGDEFFIAVIENKDGVNPLEKMAEIKETIQTTVQSAEGFFGGDKFQKFRIKNDKIEEIDIFAESIDDVKRTIFLDSLSKDLVLGRKELDQEYEFAKSSIQGINDFSLEKRKELIKFLGRRDESIYPKEIRKIEDKRSRINEKVEFLIAGHNELRLPFILNEDLDAKATIDDKSGKIHTEHMEELLDIYEGFLIDPILDEIVMSRHDFFRHLESGEISRVYAYEIKAKEINDRLSYVYCDNVIKEMWNVKFKGKIAKAVRDGKLKVGRIGGLLTISQTTDGGELDKSVIKILKDPKEIAKLFGVNNVKHKIGYAVIDVPKILWNKDYQASIEEKKLAMRATVKKVFNLPTENWLYKTFNHIFNNEKEYEKFIKALETGNTDDLGGKDIIMMISEAYFDSPKRAKNRIPTAKKILRKFGKNYREKSKQVSRLLDKILQKYSVVGVNKSIETEESREVFTPTTVDELRQRLIEYKIWDKRMKKDDGSQIIWNDERLQKLFDNITLKNIELKFVSYKKGEGVEAEIIQRLESSILKTDKSVMFSQGNYSKDYPGLWYDFGDIKK